jgi:hypothetical protein
MGPKEAEAAAAAAAARVLEAMGKAEDTGQLEALAKAVAALAARMGPQEAGRAASTAAARALEGRSWAANPGQLIGLARAVPALAAWISPQEAVQVTALALEAMLVVGDSKEEAALAEAVAALAARMGTNERRTAVALALEAMGKATHPDNSALVVRAVATLARPMSKHDLVDALKSPFCVGPAQAAVLRALEKSCGRKFASVWDVELWAAEAVPGIDLRSPPRRPSSDGEARFWGERLRPRADLPREGIGAVVEDDGEGPDWGD